MLPYLKQLMQVAAVPVWLQSVWILRPALRQVPTAPPHVLFSAFTQTTYCIRLLHTHILYTHDLVIVCPCLVCRHACQRDGPLLDHVLGDSLCQGSSGWPSLSSRLLLQSAGMKSGVIEKEVNAGLSTLFSLLSAERHEELEARKMNHRQRGDYF